MNQRFFAWMLLTLSLYMLWINWRHGQMQKEIQDKKEQEEREAKKSRDADVAREKVAEAIENANVTPPPQFPASWHTLGSMEAKDGYHLLVTLTSKGAGVERIELVEQTKPGAFRYRSLATRGGYLGYLAGTVEENGGLRVHSVPLGSAAAAAICEDRAIRGGIAIDDVLTKIDDVAIADEFAIEQLLAKRKPGSSVELTIRRSMGQADTVELQFTAKLTQPPLDVVRMQDDLQREEVPGNLVHESLRTTLANVDGMEIVPGESAILGLEATLKDNWRAEPLEVSNGMGVEFSMPLQSHLAGAGIEAKLEIVKRYRLMKANGDAKEPVGSHSAAYHIDVETIVRNLDESPHSIAVRQEGLNGVSLEGWWYAIKLSPNFSGAGARDVMLARKSGGHELFIRREIQEYARSHKNQPDTMLVGMDYPIDKRSLRYIGVDQQYFTTAILPHPNQPESLDNLAQSAAQALADIPKTIAYKDMATNIGFWFDTKSTSIPAQGELSQRYHVFAGPKDPTLLDRYGLGRSVYFGWPIFEYVAKPLSFILHTFYAVVRNYGIAIIMLTVLVRSCMFPLSRRAAIMGQRMQEMGPEMKRINELYKDDMTKRGQELQALYKKYNFNPMASCLPVFIQLPIFIGLYRCVSVDLELRQQPLIPGLEWCSNLAGPDMLATWPSWMPDFIAGKGTGWFGPYINLLPIITIALFIVQQKVLMPKATDEQTRMTQQMMMVMTVFMGVLFFKVPAGLCIYFITSSIWSLIERKLVKRFIPAMPNLATVGSASVAAPPPAPPKPAKPKTSTKSPETISDVVDQVKSLWSKARKSSTPAKTAVNTDKKRKQRKRR